MAEELFECEGVLCRKGTRDRDAVKEVSENWGILEPGPTDHVVDMGAHIGAFSVLAARAGAEVVAYEPHPENYELLKRNLSPWPRATAIPAAVTGSGGLVMLYVTRSVTNTMSHSITPVRGRTRLVVNSASLLDTLAGEPTLAKIDIEGAEHEIGLDKVKWPQSLRAVAIEIELPSYARANREWWGDSADRIVENLYGHGFSTDQSLDWPSYTQIKAGPYGRVFNWAEANLVFRR